MSEKSKNMYADKLENMFNKYNNTYHRTIKIKPMMLNRRTQWKKNYEKELQKTTQTKFRVKKVIMKKGKKVDSKNKINFELDLSNYAIKNYKGDWKGTSKREQQGLLRQDLLKRLI